MNDHQWQEDAGNQVVVYSKPGCFGCRKSIEILDEQGVPNREVDLTREPAALDYVKSLGYSSAPVIVLPSGEHWSGLRPDRLRGLGGLGGLAVAHAGDEAAIGPPVRQDVRQRIALPRTDHSADASAPVSMRHTPVPPAHSFRAC